MKVTLVSTTQIVELSGVRARIWEGTTDKGVRVQAYIAVIAVEIGQAGTLDELYDPRDPSPMVGKRMAL